MNSVSSNDPRGQHPDIIPFDLHAEAEPVSPAHPGANDGSDDFDHDRDTVLDTGGDGSGDNDDDPPPANVGAALIIRAPRGVLPARPGFTIAAVVIELDPIDGGEDIIDAQFLTTHKLQSVQVAVSLANYKSGFPKKLPAGSTHIVVNDETGHEMWRKPVLRVA